jgi:hypothetical protein
LSASCQPIVSHWYLVTNLSASQVLFGLTYH